MVYCLAGHYLDFVVCLYCAALFLQFGDEVEANDLFASLCFFFQECLFASLGNW